MADIIPRNANPPVLQGDVVTRRERWHIMNQHELFDLAEIGVSAAIILAFFSLFVGSAITYSTTLASAKFSPEQFAYYSALYTAMKYLAWLSGALLVWSVWRLVRRLRSLRTGTTVPFFTAGIPGTGMPREERQP